MSTKVFIIHAEDIVARCIPALQEQGIDPVLISMRASDVTEPFKRAAPDATLLSACDACYGTMPRGSPIPLRAARLDELEAVSSVLARVMFMLDQNNDQHWPVTDLQRITYDMVGVWGAILDHHKPDAVIFNFDVSYRGFDLLLFELCQARGIETLCLKLTLIDDRVLATHHPFDMPGPTQAELTASKATATELPPALAGGTGDLFAYANDMARIRKKLTLRDIGRDLIGRQLARIEHRTGIFYDANPRKYKWRLLNVAGKLQTRHLLNVHDEVATKPDINVPYVYFPLQVQPEASTCIETGLLTDLVHMAKIIAEALPHGWQLYVREHPNQFNRTFRMRSGRGPDFYRWIAQTPNVKLTTLDASPKALIGNAKATVVAAGSSGWESLNAGKPTFAFGYPWYMKAPGLNFVKGVEDLRKGFERIIDGTLKVDRDLLAKYRAVMAEKYTYPLVWHSAFIPVLGDRANAALETHVQWYPKVIAQNLKALKRRRPGSPKVVPDAAAQAG